MERYTDWNSANQSRQSIRSRVCVSATVEMARFQYFGLPGPVMDSTMVVRGACGRLLILVTAVQPVEESDDASDADPLLEHQAPRG